jgi:hypothetical protein
MPPFQANVCSYAFVFGMNNGSKNKQFLAKVLTPLRWSVIRRSPFDNRFGSATPYSQSIKEAPMPVSSLDTQRGLKSNYSFVNICLVQKEDMSARRYTFHSHRQDAAKASQHCQMYVRTSSMALSTHTRAQAGPSSPRR